MDSHQKLQEEEATKFDLSFLTLSSVEPDDLSVVVYILVFDSTTSEKEGEKR